MDRKAPWANAFSGGEVTCAVEQQLVTVHGAVGVGAGNGLVVKINLSRHKATDKRTSRRKSPMCVRWKVDLSHPGLKAVNRKDNWVHTSVPTDHIEWALRKLKSSELTASFYNQVPDPFVEGPSEFRSLEISVAIGRIHTELTGLISPLLRDVYAAWAFHREPILRPGIRNQSVENSFGNPDIVVLLEPQISKGASHQSASLENEDQFVAIYIAHVNGVRNAGSQDGDHYILIEDQRTPRIDRCARVRLQVLSTDMVLAQRIVFGHFGCWPSLGGGLASVLMGSMLVIENAVRSIKAAPCEALFPKQTPFGVGVFYMVFWRDVPSRKSVEH
jgi:hypothetical protein